MRGRLLTELLAQAGLAQSELQKERVKADRDARIAQTWASLVPQVVDAGTRVAEGVGKAQDAEAARLVAQYKDFTGENVKRVRVDPERGPLGEVQFLKPAQEEAQRIVSERVKDPLHDVLGIVKANTKAVREKALAGIAANIAEGRKAAQAAAQQEAKTLAEFQRGMRSEGRDDRKLSQTDARMLQDRQESEANRLADEQKLNQQQGFQRELTGQEHGLRREQMQQQSSEAEKNRNLQRELAKMRQEAKQEQKKLPASGKQGNPKQPGEEKGYRLPTPVIDRVAGMDAAIGLIDQFASESFGIKTGLIPKITNDLAQRVNWDDPKVTTFRAKVSAVLAAYVKTQSGTGASDNERKFLATITPSMTDSPETFLWKSKAFREHISKERDALLNANKAAGYDVGKLPEIRPVDGPKKTLQERVDELFAENPALTNEEIYKIIQAEGLR